MDRFTEILVEEFYDLKRQIGEEGALKLMEIESRYAIANAVRDCFESSNKIPSIPEAIIMASNDISKALEGTE